MVWPHQRRADIERELSLIAAKKEHLVDSIAAGDKDPAIFARLKVEETRRKELTHQLEALRTVDQVVSLGDVRLKRELKAGWRIQRRFSGVTSLDTTIASNLTRASVAV